MMKTFLKEDTIPFRSARLFLFVLVDKNIIPMHRLLWPRPGILDPGEAFLSLKAFKGVNKQQVLDRVVMDDGVGSFGVVDIRR